MANEGAIAGLAGFERALARSPSDALQSAAIAINAGAEFAERTGRSRVHGKLNLDESYVDRNLYIHSKADSSDIVARIRAKRRGILAPRFGAKQRTAPVSSRRGRVAGDPSRGIPRGQKGAGSTAWSVLRGGRSRAWKNAFFVKLSGSGAWAMVARYGSGAGLSAKADWAKNLDVVQGYSVDQVWRNEREQVAREAMVVANQRFAREFERRISGG
ncbi:MAG: hypothetical protein AAGI11_15295 [Pseudomonadota bacterium]